MMDKELFDLMNSKHLSLIKNIKSERVKKLAFSNEKILDIMSTEELVEHCNSSDSEIRTLCAESNIVAKRVPIDILRKFISDDEYVVSAISGNKEAVKRFDNFIIEVLARNELPYVRRNVLLNKEAVDKISSKTLRELIKDEEPIVRIAASSFYCLARHKEEFIKDVLYKERDNRVRTKIVLFLNKIKVLSNLEAQHEINH
ncbi:MAG: HEAT repeat domain-containing protein [Candidatus Micrarchaeia archaeon]